MDFELARVLVAVIGTAYVAWQDAKTSFMDERVLYAMLAFGLVLDFATFQPDFIVFSVGGAALIFGAGYLLYRGGQLGGGDVLLLAGLQSLLPFSPSIVRALTLPLLMPSLQTVPVLVLAAVSNAVPFIASVFIAGTLLALIGSSIHYGLKLRGRKMRPELLAGGLALVAAIAVLGVSYDVSGLRIGHVLLVVLALAPAVFLAAFRKQIQDELIMQRIPVSKVQDEDVLMTEYLDARLVKKYKLGRVLTKAEVEKLKAVSRKEGIKSFPVATDLPRFGPYLFLGLLVCLAVGDVIAFLLLL